MRKNELKKLLFHSLFFMGLIFSTLLILDYLQSEKELFEILSLPWLSLQQLLSFIPVLCWNDLGKWSKPKNQEIETI